MADSFISSWKRNHSDGRDDGDDDYGSARSAKDRHDRHHRHEKGKTMKKNVQISRELFLALIRYHLFDLRGDEERIRKELEKKMNALYRHELYETSKTAATSAEREKRDRPIWMRRVCRKISDGRHFLRD